MSMQKERKPSLTDEMQNLFSLSLSLSLSLSKKKKKISHVKMKSFTVV